MPSMDLPSDFYAGRWDQANIPIKFRGLRFQDYDSDMPEVKRHETRKIAVQASRDFVEGFEDRFVSAKRAAAGQFPADRSNIGKGLLFYGRNGTRKSTLAAIIATEVQYLSPSYRTFYIRFSDWKRALTDTFTKEETERTVEAKKILKLAELSHLLILDDIGQEHRTSSGFTESSLHELLRIRYEAARPTISTTNIDADSFRGIYGDSFESFRHDAFDTYMILGRDTRIVKD